MSAAAPARAVTPALEAVAPRAVARAVPVRLLLGAIVGLSTLGHVVLSWLRPMPSLFPDEYIYAALGRSLIHTGRPLVRGGSAHFPALLEPILTAPVWLVHDVDTAYRILQFQNALTISLAAIPVYLIARRLRLAPWMSLALAGLAVATPQTLYANSVLAEPFSYPLLFSAILAAMALIEEPTRRRRILFVALVLLAALARVQLAVIPACALAAALANGIRERRLRRTLRDQWILVAIVAAGLCIALALSATHHLGYYGALLPNGLAGGDALHIGSVSVYVVLLSAGCALVPGAAVGWALALAKPRSRAEFVFACFATTLALALLAQCALYGDLHLVQERYLMYLVPLVGVFFALRATRRERRWLAELGTGAALSTAAAILPLAGYAKSSVQSIAPALFAVNRVEQTVGLPGTASLIVAVVATVLAGVAAAAAARPRAGTPLVLALSLAFSLAALAGGFSFDRSSDLRVRKTFLPADRSWVDHAHVGRVTYLAATGASRNVVLAAMFWNPSIDRLVRLPATASFDGLPQAVGSVAPDGTLEVHGQPVRRAVVADESLTTVELRDARRLAHWNVQTLWVPSGPVRLGSVMVGRPPSGHLLTRGALLLWPGTTQASGWLELRVSASKRLPHGGGLRFKRPDAKPVVLTVPSGGSRLFRVPVCGGSWQAPYTTVPRYTEEISAGVPRFVPDPAACS